MDTVGSSPAGTVRVATLVASVAAVGCLVMAVAHAGVSIPLLSALGPGGNRVIVPAIIAFGVGMALFGGLAYGLRRGARWAWFGGLLISAGAVASGVMQYRGVVSAAGIVLAVVLGALLLAPASRRYFLKS